MRGLLCRITLLVVLVLPSVSAGGLLPAGGGTSLPDWLQPVGSMRLTQGVSQFVGESIFTQLYMQGGCGAEAWMDYDNDGDLDIAYSGTVLHNIGSDTFMRLPTARMWPLSSIACGDYDGDGDIDISLIGSDNRGASGAVICRNDAGGSLSDIGAPLSMMRSGASAWGDYDNDGDLDLVVVGDSFDWRGCRIYRNDGVSGFSASLPAIADGTICDSVAWGDYDNDGDLDLVVGGQYSRIYRNDGGTFSAAWVQLPSVSASSVAWGDYDSDGDLDLAISGLDLTRPTPVEGISRIYRNDGGGAFTAISTSLPQLSYSALTWGDYDNDGDLDLAISGYLDFRCQNSAIIPILRNDAGTFVTGCIWNCGLAQGALEWGDYDGDGDLDLLASGRNILGAPQTWILRNDGSSRNSPPSAPTGLTASYDDDGVVLSWNASTDTETPQAGLSYNLRVGTSIGGHDVFAGMADPQTGLRRIPAIGNAQKRLSWRLKGVTAGGLCWSVQAIDSAYAGSAWAADVVTGRVISGRVTSKGIGLGRITVHARPGGGSATTDSGGRYAICVPDGWSGSITPDGAGYTFEPDHRSYTDVRADLQNQDYAVMSGFRKGVVTLPGLVYGDLAWGDYDNDGVMDLAVSGCTSLSDPYFFVVTRIYHNDGSGVLSDIKAGLPGAILSSLNWGDYDNDGDLDLAISGSDSNGPVNAVYRNDDGRFVDSGGVLSAAPDPESWGDYDNDGDLDHAVLREDDGTTRIMRNDGYGIYTDIGVVMPSTSWGTRSWVDFDNDGDLDLAIAGSTPDWSSGIAAVYRNDGNGVFTDIKAGLMSLPGSSLAWGDYDNDGYPDLVVLGIDHSTGECRAKLYHNSGSSFADTGVALTGAAWGSAAWCDYDNDGDLDLSISGLCRYAQVASDMECATFIYRNDCGVLNPAPAAPAGLSSTVNGSDLTLRWSASTDDHTPSSGLTYNLRVGTAPGKGDVLSAMADPATGLRRVPAMGNAQQNLTWTIKGIDLKSHDYYWSVQAIDSGFAGSAWAAEQVISCPTNDSISPSSQAFITGNRTALTCTYSDREGNADIKNCYLLINKQCIAPRGISLFYQADTNKLYLRNDTGTAWLGGFAPGTNNAVTNSQCILSCKDTSVTRSGDQVIVSWSIQPKSTLSGASYCGYMRAEDRRGLTFGWQKMGTFGFQSVPVNVSLSPSTGSISRSSNTIFTARYSDSDGCANISKCYVLLNKTLTASNGIQVMYDAGANKLWLMDDAGTTWTGGFAPGSPNTLENSQCKIPCAGALVVTASGGTDITLRLPIRPQSATAGWVCGEYMKVEDKSGLIDNWEKKGTVTIR